MPSTETRTYFGPHDLPLYGALHLPTDRRVHGTAAVFAPLAKEQGDTVRGLRRLAALLAESGLAVLRFDYYGTGDSALPAGQPRAVTEWIASGTHALAYLRTLHPSEPAVIALRAGALIAAQVCAASSAQANTAPSALVLWEPVLRGRSFVRAQQALAALTVGAPDNDGRATWVGMTVHEQAVDALAALTVPPKIGAGTPLQIASSDDAPAAGFPHADHLVTDGMPQFLQATSHLVRIPDAAVEDIAAWTSRTLSEGPTVAVTPHIRRRAVITTPGGTVEERIDTVSGAETIRTLPLDSGTAQSAPAVLSFATANDSRVGPNREWVELGRAVAALGGTAVRFDRRGSGESGEVCAGESVALFPATALVDARAVAATMSAPEELLVTGFCSGSWYAAQLARDGHAGAAVLVNTVLYSWRLKRALAEVDGTADLGVPRSDPAFTGSMRGRFKQALRARLPYPLWHGLGLRGITQVPGVLVGRLAAAGVRTTVVLAPDDARWFDDQRGHEGWQRACARTDGGALTQIRPAAGDHPGYHPSVRDATTAEILQWVRERLT